MLNNRHENRSTHHPQNRKGGESHIIFQEIGEIVVVEEYQEESGGGDEEDEDEGVEERAFELVGGGIGGVLDVDEIGGGSDGVGGVVDGGGE